MSATCPVSFWSRQRPDAPALWWGERRWSYAELDAEVTRWTNRLRSRGVGPGERLVVLSNNRPELVMMLHATFRLGAVWTPLNARLTAAELSPLCARAQARCLLAEEALRERLPQAASLEALAELRPDPSSPPTGSPELAAALLFTSGTSGVPKGALLGREAWVAGATASAARLGTGDGGWLACLPLFHVGGLAMVVRAAHHGLPLVLQAGFEPGQVAWALERHQVSFLSLVPTTLARLLQSDPQDAPSTLAAVLVGGAPASPELLAQARGRRWKVLQTYGLTEACSQVATERRGEADGRTAGPPLTGTKVRVVDPWGRPLRQGEEGELEVQGPTLMRGYFGDAPGSLAAMRDGWLRTGDLGAVDEEGRIRVLCRRLDLIVSGGENVYPAEVEAVLQAHPEVAEAAVVPLQDEGYGQAPVALWAPRASPRASGNAPQDAVGGQALAAWCRSRLASFKVPRQFIAVSQLPRNAAGKVDRQRALAIAVTHASTPREGKSP